MIGRPLRQLASHAGFFAGLVLLGAGLALARAAATFGNGRLRN